MWQSPHFLVGYLFFLAGRIFLLMVPNFHQSSHLFYSSRRLFLWVTLISLYKFRTYPHGMFSHFVIYPYKCVIFMEPVISVCRSLSKSCRPSLFIRHFTVMMKGAILVLGFSVLSPSIIPLPPTSNTSFFHHPNKMAPDVIKRCSSFTNCTNLLTSDEYFARTHTFTHYRQLYSRIRRTLAYLLDGPWLCLGPSIFIGNCQRSMVVSRQILWTLVGDQWPTGFVSMNQSFFM